MSLFDIFLLILCILNFIIANMREDSEEKIMTKEEISKKLEQMRMNNGHSDESFVSPGYPYHSDLVDFIYELLNEESK